VVMGMMMKGIMRPMPRVVYVLEDVIVRGGRMGFEIEWCSNGF